MGLAARRSVSSPIRLPTTSLGSLRRISTWSRSKEKMKKEAEKKAAEELRRTIKKPAKRAMRQKPTPLRRRRASPR